MRKFVFTFSLVGLMTFSLCAQVLISPEPNSGLSKKHHQMTKVDPASKALFSDTLAYVWMKYTTAASMQISSTIAGLSQYYTCPQAITIKGFDFYADAVSVASQNLTCALYTASGKLPTGTALATATVTVDSINANGLVCRAMFSTPIVVTAPYCITISNSSANAVRIYLDGDGDGNNEDLSGIYYGGSWQSILTLAGYDLDVLADPIVSYNIPDVYFTKSVSCINNGDNVVFDMTAGPVYSDPMYSYLAYQDSIRYQFQWNFGDDLNTYYAMDTNHTYATAAAYTITLFDNFIGWYFYISRDTTATIDACVGINENSNAELSIYPNPVTNILNVVNAENSTIEIISMIGTTVKRIESASKNQHIDISNMSNGTYFVRVINGGNIVTRKISVVR